MPDEGELSFNAWVLTGNVLQALLRGQNAVAAGAGRDRLERLDAALGPVQPTAMLSALRGLAAEDRALLVEGVVAVQMAAGVDAEAVLGLGVAEVAEVVGVLQP